jgi:hypothetical protein
MALSSFMANCFKYLLVSKMKPICIPQIFYEDSEFINHSRQKTSLYVFFLFETSKFWGLLDHVTSSANGCGAPGPWRNPFRSVPRPPPPAQCRQNRLFGIAASGEKGLSEGLGKEYMIWCETSVGKTGTQAEGRHVVIRASQG